VTQPCVKEPWLIQGISVILIVASHQLLAMLLHESLKFFLLVR